MIFTASNKLISIFIECAIGQRHLMTGKAFKQFKRGAFLLRDNLD